MTKKPGIYLLTNKINKKQYIGESINLHKRFLCHKLCSTGKLRKYPTLIEKSIKTYGWNNFEIRLLEIIYNNDFYNKDQIKNYLLYKESKLIIEYNSLYPIGYNLSKYGKGHAGIIRTNSYRKRQSESSKKQDYSKWNKSVKQIDINTGQIIKIWKSAKEASFSLKGTNNLRGPISTVCNKKIFIKNGYKCIAKTAGGFYWEFLNDKERYT